MKSEKYWRLKTVGWSSFEANKETRQQMMDIANQDKTENSIEYGAFKDDGGNYIETSGTGGEIDHRIAKNPNEQKKLESASSTNDIMHTHSSETKDAIFNTPSGNEEYTVNAYIQKPSTPKDRKGGDDITNLKNGQKGYVFAMGMKTNPNGVNPETAGGQRVYMYQKDSNGNLRQASLPLNRFVNYKKKKK